MPDAGELRDWAAELVEQARAEGVELTGDDGLLTALVRRDSECRVCYRVTNVVKQVLQSSSGLRGQSGIHTGMTNTQNTPLEALERSYPLRVLKYRLRQGSGGRGYSPGGDGIERDLQVLEDCTVSLITERRVSRPPGLWGGEPGAPGENWLLPAGDESQAKRLPDKCTIRLRTGDVVRMLTPGGGGWGPPPPT